MHCRNFLVKNNANRVCFKGYLEVTIQSRLKNAQSAAQWTGPIVGILFPNLVGTARAWQVWRQGSKVLRSQAPAAIRGRPGGHIKDNRELKILRERRPRKRRLESEFAFFQSLSRLLQLINFVKCKRTLFEPNSLEPYSNSERGRKFSRPLFTSPIKREIRHFPVVVLLWLQRNVQNSVTLLFCLFNQLLSDVFVFVAVVAS